MIRTLLLSGVLAVGVASAYGQQAPPAAAVVSGETIAEVRVHGNAVTPTDEVLALAGVTVGGPVETTTIDEVADRLRRSRRFDSVEVLKRYASLSDPSQILIIVIVDEGPIRIVRGRGDQPARAVAIRGPQPLWFPILGGEDGYGLSYGVRLAFANPVGAQSRVSFPVAWGGRKRAGAELEKRFDGGLVTRAIGGVGITRERNPFYREDDTRSGVWVRAERDVTRQVRVGVGARWDEVTFGTVDDRVAHLGGDIIFDTRLDPLLARNAVYARAGWERLSFREAESANRVHLEARGYLGLIGQTVLVTKVLLDDADRALPPFAQSLLGGARNLRGIRAGTAAGDTLVVGSAELFVPLTSPLGIARAGVSAFLDVGTVYDNGARLSEQRFERGGGGGVWLTAGFFQVTLSVARGTTGATRVHFNTSASF